jgi:ADP-dependent NAD(P)H-hydrate dehydratase / NAD(P)H-hydrate epimerase
MSIKPIFTASQMMTHERLLFDLGKADPFQTMDAAGLAVAQAIQARQSHGFVLILCGPGNNGGDGYCCARHLQAMGYDVRVCGMEIDAKARQAQKMRALWRHDVLPIAAAQDLIVQADILVDALFGIGLSRALDDPQLITLASIWNAQQDKLRAAIDIPSGLSADCGTASGAAFQADFTLTFGYLKPAHILESGRSWCGESACADIGLTLDTSPNAPLMDAPSIGLITAPLNCVPRDMAHKYRRGHALIFSGGPLATGAARLAALAASRSSWVGAVSLLGSPEALLVHAHHVSAIMLKQVTTPQQLSTLLADHKPQAFLIGPAAGLNDETRNFVLAALASSAPIVLDADALTLFSPNFSQDLNERTRLCKAIAARSGAITVITPHEGEFARLFPDIDQGLSKIKRAQQASACTGAIVVLKGPESVIASPAGRVLISTHASPWLATAGSGDVLAGLITAALAACAPAQALECVAEAVYLHGEAGLRLGPGLVAEDLPAQFPQIWRSWLTKPDKPKR